MDPVNEYFSVAFEEAFHSVRLDIGGPFGAVVVQNGSIIGRGGNRVISSHDPTAHAEIVAIRDACKNIGSFDLSGCQIYATCEPCPMCLAAIYWANIGHVYFCSDRHDAEAIGFRDNHLYEELPKEPSKRVLPFTRVHDPKGAELFGEWEKKMDKQPY